MNYELTLGERIDVLMGDQRYPSDVQGFSQDGELILSAPTYKSMTVPLVKGELLHLVYYREAGMFSFMAELISRFREGEMDLIKLKLKSPISKYQRRDFVRLDLLIPVSIRLLASRDNVERRSLDEALRLLYDQRYVGIPRPALQGEHVAKCLTLDLSGGGARFSGSELFEEGALLECTLHLSETLVITVDAQVVRVIEEKGDFRPYRTAVRFVNIEERLRRKIIKFIFDRQTRARREELDQ